MRVIRFFRIEIYNSDILEYSWEECIWQQGKSAKQLIVMSFILGIKVVEMYSPSFNGWDILGAALNT